MSAVKLIVHFVWSTKNRVPLLVPEIRQDVFAHIKQNALSKAIDLMAVNGYSDHVHCLIRLTPSQNVEDTARLLKGESSHWINRNNIIKDEYFQWQRKYYAESIGVKDLKKMTGYIRNQEIHHEQETINIKRELHLLTDFINE